MRPRNRILLRGIGAVLAISAGLGGAVPAGADTITVTGSETMLLLARRWAEEYMAGHSNDTIQVSGGGSSTGIAALIARTTDIATSTRPLRPAEAKTANAAGIGPVEHKVAMSALAVVVHEDNPLDTLTLNQVKAIYTGAINDWQDLGGPHLGIVRYIRAPDTATHAFFKEIALGNREYAPDCRPLAGPAAIDSAVAGDPAAIGYGATAYSLRQAGVKVLRIKKDRNAAAITPLAADGKSVDLAVVHSGAYPLTRTLYCVTGGAPRAAVAAYLAWIAGPEGQRIVAEMGFVPVPAGGGAGRLSLPKTP